MKRYFISPISLLSFVLIFSGNSAFSNEITVKFIGNCGLHFTDGTTNIYTDFPYKSGAYNYMEYDAVELDNIQENSTFIFTHKHADHYSGKEVRKALKTKNGKKYGKWNISKLEKLKETIPDFDIQVFKTKHRFSFSHYSYLITWHGKKIFLSGDTESAATIGNVKGIDWAFIPYWILADAAENDIKIDAKRRVLYHLYPNQKISGEIPEDMIVLDKQNKVIKIQY